MKKGLVITGGTILCGKIQLDNENIAYDRPVYNDLVIAYGLLIEKHRKDIGEEPADKLYSLLTDTKEPLKNILFPPQNADERYEGEQNRDFFTRLNFIGHSLQQSLAEVSKVTGEDMPFVPSMKEIQNSEKYDINSPCRVDSITVDFQNTHSSKTEYSHYELEKLIYDNFKKYDTNIIVGGTDTKPYYVTALAADLEYRDILKDNRKAIFISSMYSFEKNPLHNINLFKKADILSEQLEGAGSFVISSVDPKAHKVVVHDPMNHFTKVSSKLSNPFRSREPVGWIEGDVFTKNPAYEKTETLREIPVKIRQEFLKDVAPPLIIGNRLEEANRYLHSLAKSDRPFDAIIIEYDEKKIQGPSKHFELFKNLIKHHAEIGTRVYLNNPLIYDQISDSMLPKVNNENFLNNRFVKQIEEAGARVKTGVLTKDIFLSRLLSSHSVDKPSFKLLPELLESYDDKQRHPLALGYIPVSKDMKYTMKLLKDSQISNVVLSGLPGNTVPSYMITSLEKNFGDNFKISFENNGKRMKDHDGTVYIEGEGINTYAAGADSMNYGSGIKNPSQVLDDFRGKGRY